jgi:RND family efflux transporter MFP subunit
VNKQTQGLFMSTSNPLRHTAWLTLAAVLVASALTACSEPEAEREIIRPVRAVMVGDIGQLQRRGFPGRAQAAQEIDLAFRVGGPLISRPVNVGDRVEEGGLVAQIDPRDFEVNLRNVQAQLTEAEAARERAAADFRRQQNMFNTDPGATSEAAVDRAREERDRAAAAVESLNATVTNAQDQLDDTRLLAPFDGTVVATYVENFQNVRQKQPVVRILDTARIEMVINVPENLISLIPAVHTAKLRFDAFPDREFEGRITEVGTEASQTTRTFPVTVMMDQPDDVRILPGMAGQANAGEVDPAVDQQRGGPSVPVGAVFTPDTETSDQVWVIKRGEGDLGVLERRSVKTGPLTQHGVVITEGLSSGEWILTAGVHSVKEGQTVRILKAGGA